jgi:hypothetical protein
MTPPPPLSPLQKLQALYRAIDDAERELDRADQSGDAASWTRARLHFEAAQVELHQLLNEDRP